MREVTIFAGYRTLMMGFVLIMLLPLAMMGGAAFNDTPFPSLLPWNGGTLRWFRDMLQDARLWIAIGNTLLVALAVVVMAVPIGTAGALVINQLSGAVRSVLYGLMIAPMLTPGAVVGISTLIFWSRWSVWPGLHLSVLGQVSYIATFVMLLALSRLQSFNRSFEEAARDLGATHFQVFRKIVLPHLYPVLGIAAFLAFFQSVENFNVTLFTRGSSDTLTVYIFSRLRAGITPTINAVSLVLVLSAALAIGFHWWCSFRRQKCQANIQFGRQEYENV